MHNITQKNRKMSDMDTAKKPTTGDEPRHSRSGKQFLLLIGHPPCYSYIQVMYETHYTNINTNTINNTLTIRQTNGVKTNWTSLLCGNRIVSCTYMLTYYVPIRNFRNGDMSFIFLVDWAKGEQPASRLG